MAKIWEPKPKEVLQQWIEAIEQEASDKLSEWEENFIDSLNHQLLYKDHLSQAQEERLEAIYVKYTS